MRWGPAMGLGLLAGALNLLFFMFLESPLWDMTIQLFSWFVPPAEGAMAAYSTIATTCAAGVLMYFFFLLTVLCGGLQYFSFREVGDQLSLHEDLEQQRRREKSGDWHGSEFGQFLPAFAMAMSGKKVVNWVTRLR